MQAPDQLSWRMPKLDIATDAIAEFGRKFLWWEPIDGQPHSEDRIIAQTMNLGTFDDILLLEQTVGNARLVEIMMNAEPGWLNDRYRGILARAAVVCHRRGDPERGSAE